jgi:hypothetical protein
MAFGTFSSRLGIQMLKSSDESAAGQSSIAHAAIK